MLSLLSEGVLNLRYVGLPSCFASGALLNFL